ncbi:IclR family transcriptional regulator [Micrococcales bacterium 31B]|nr:IclR family transcriptional regulator [Micrococcales bacterium 31B]
MAEPAVSQTTVRSVDRAFDLLDLLERAPEPLRLVDLSKGSGLHTATVLRLLAVLQQRGYVETSNGTYRIGPAALGAAHGYLRTSPLVLRSRPLLQELAAATGLTASLYVRSGNERLLVSRVDGTQPLRYQLPLGQRLPLHSGAGLPILAFLPGEARESYVAALTDFETADGRTVSTSHLRDLCEATRTNGYHISHSERAIGVTAASVPVLGGDHTAVGALSISGPSEHNTTDGIAALLPELQRAAHAVSLT